jgi:hypothetical protein
MVDLWDIIVKPWTRKHTTDTVYAVLVGDVLVLRTKRKSKYFRLDYLDTVECNWETGRVTLMFQGSKCTLEGESAMEFMNLYIGAVNAQRGEENDIPA